MKLLKSSDISVYKATGLIVQLMGDNAKLLKLVAEKCYLLSTALVFP